LIESQQTVCPVCGDALDGGDEWAVRRAGHWVRLRTRQCLDRYEREPTAAAGAAGDRSKAGPPAWSEWAVF